MSFERNSPVTYGKPGYSYLRHLFLPIKATLFFTTLVLTLAGFLALCGSATAEIPAAPTVNALKAKLNLSLPPYWKVDDLSIEAAANYGNAVEPKIKQRLLAVIGPVDDLYIPAGKSDKITFLMRTMKAGETRKLYLLATSVLWTGSWKISFDEQNDPTANAGKPRAFFGGATIVKGSAEDAAYQKEQADEAAARRQEEVLGIQHRQAVAAAEAKVQVEKMQHDAELQAARTKAEQTEAAARWAAFQESLKAIQTNARNLLKADLPPYWQIKTFALSKPADVAEGTVPASEAVVRQHFVATITLTDDTFVRAQKGTVQLLRPMLKAGTERKIEGTVESIQAAEGWRSKLNTDNPVGRTDGQPLSYYAGTPIIEGSPEEAEYRKQQAEEAAAQQQRELTAIQHQQAVAAAESKAQVEKVEQDADLQAAKTKAEQTEAAARWAAFQESLKAIQTNARNLLKADLPPYWQIKTFHLSKPADVAEGTAPASEAVVRQVFSATVALKEDTFVTAGADTVTLLRHALKPGTERKIEGTVDSVQATEGWRSKLNTSNPIDEADGKPLSYYSGTAIIEGSPEYTAYQKQQTAILQAGAIAPGTYKDESGYPATCEVTNMTLADGRIRSFFVCRRRDGNRWNASFVSGPASEGNPIFQKLVKNGINQHADAKDYTWGEITNGYFLECRGGGYGTGTLIGAKKSGPLLILSPFYKRSFQCEAAFARTGRPGRLGTQLRPFR